MDPEQRCDRRRCNHALKFHNPCSRCVCHAFMVPMTDEERAAAGLKPKKGSR